MKVGDVVAWTPTRGVWCAQKVKFVGVVTGVHLAMNLILALPAIEK